MMSYGNSGAQEWALGPDDAKPIVRQAVEGGITFFDTADMYSGGVSEEITGRLLAKFFPRRDDYLLATKVYYPTGAGPNDRGPSFGALHIRAHEPHGGQHERLQRASSGNSWAFPASPTR